jgi:5'-nucleotidase
MYDNIDPSMLTVIDKWKPSVTKITNVTVGRTTVELLNNCHLMECNIGNLIADSFVYYVSIFKCENYFIHNIIFLRTC